MVSQNLHSVYQFHHDDELRKMQSRASYIRIDGLPLVIFGRLLGYPIGGHHRTGWMDWLDPFMTEATASQWRIFYLGSEPNVAERGESELRRRYPNLPLMVHHGHFDMSEAGDDNRSVVEAINTFGADVVIVGMGMPRQERWILANEDKINASVFLTAGACLDYVAGAIPIPPRWLGRIGLEWLFRLVSEPKRLWKRYLLEPWYAGGLFLRDLWERCFHAKTGAG